MNLLKTVTTVCCMALVGAILAPSARADDWNRKSEITFSGPVEIPGVHLRGWGVLPAGQPEALRAWFYPGRNWGEEFVYSKAKAIELAQATKTPVLFTPIEIPLEFVMPLKSAYEPMVVELKQAPVMAITPAGEEVQLAEVVTPPPAETQVAMAPAPTVPEMTLPATASTLPLIGLLGLLALGGAFAVRALTKRVQ